ncbi:MAG: hypothetical protein DRJ67_05740 [Thermoprotei archaeon]|nr:MAG: hypothetical protein DRJ67_05740 [Thermoprotei archaeon]
MRTSRWLAAERYSIRRRSKRFIVETEGGREEVAAPRIYLLALLGDGWVTSGALELAYEEGVFIAFVGDPLTWLEPRPVRGVEYVMAQYEPERGEEVYEAILDSWLRGARELLRRLRAPPIGASIEELREELRKSVASRLGLGEGEVEALEKACMGFLKAEALCALHQAGLSPHLSLSGEAPLLEEFSLEFEHELVWKPLIGLGRRVGLGSWELLRRALRAAKDRLEGYVSPRTTLRSLMWRRAKALAASLLNPLMRYEAGGLA